MDNREACIILNLLFGVGYTRFKALTDEFGSALDIFSVSENDLKSVAGVGKSLSNKIVNWEKHTDLQHEIELTVKAGVRVVTIYDNDYPKQLKEIPDPPLCLYVRGELSCQIENSIAVVGSRRVTSYGREMVEFLVSGLAYSDWTIVSGLAYGIDAIAHQTAVNSNGVTVAVLGGGLARLHPQDHIGLARNIIEKGGAVISEFPMQMSPTRQTFPMRNRVISGLCSGVLVVEAGVKSGSLITANCALEQGRLVFAVPGNANAPLSRGCNLLIKEGAVLTENIDDILNEFEFLPNISRQSDSDKVIKSSEQKIDGLGLSSEELKIIKSIELEEKSVDLISMETKIPIHKILGLLLKLEMRKIIVQLPGKIYKFRNKQ